MGRAAPRQIDYQRMIRALKAEGVPVDKLTPVVGVHGLALLRPGETLASIAGQEEGVEEWDRATQRQ